jgi:hypothetical protein
MKSTFTFYYLSQLIRILFISSFIVLVGNNLLMSQSDFVLKYNNHDANIKSIQLTDDHKLVFPYRIDDKTMAILKTDTLGNILSKITFSDTAFYFNSWSYDFIKSGDYYYFLSNIIKYFSSSYGPQLIDIPVIIAFNNELNIIWSKNYFSTSSNIFNSICPTVNSGFMFVGSGCSGKHLFINCDSNGNILWQKDHTAPYMGSYTGSNNYKLLKMNSNSYIDFTKFGDGELLYILNLDSLGNLLQFNYLSGFLPQGLGKSADNGIVLFGTKYIDRNSICIIKLDSNLSTSWAKEYSTNYQNIIYDYTPLNNNTNMFVGSTLINNNQYALIGSVDSIGNLLWLKKDVPLNYGISSLNSCIVDPFNNAFIGVSSSSGISLIKTNYSVNGFCNLNNVSFNNPLSFIFSNLELPMSPGFLTYIVDTFNLNITNDYSLISNIVCGPLVNINDNISVSDISVFPNPAFNQLNIQYDSGLNLNFQLYDILGIKKKSFLLNKNFNKLILDVSGLPVGLYFYTISDSNNKNVKSDKIIISR